MVDLNLDFSVFKGKKGIHKDIAKKKIFEENKPVDIF